MPSGDAKHILGASLAGVALTVLPLLSVRSAPINSGWIPFTLALLAGTAFFCTGLLIVPAMRVSERYWARWTCWPWLGAAVATGVGTILAVVVTSAALVDWIIYTAYVAVGAFSYTGGLLIYMAHERRTARK